MAAGWIERWERGCRYCKVLRDVMTIHDVFPPRESFGYTQPRVVVARRVCVDTAACEKRRSKRCARRGERSKRLVIAWPLDPDAPRGWCKWCGFAILKPDVREVDRRRQYHRAECGERDCYDEWSRSYAYDAQRCLVLLGADRCVDCGSTGEWEADHEVALEDGGIHDPDNLSRRCLACHRAKTSRENRARAAARRNMGKPPYRGHLELV